MKKAIQRIVLGAAAVAMTASLSVIATPAQEASAVYNRVFNQTGRTVTLQWTNGYWVGLGNGTDTNDVRQVKIPTGQCMRFIGPGVNTRYCAVLAPLYKTTGPGSWFLQP